MIPNPEAPRKENLGQPEIETRPTLLRTSTRTSFISTHCRQTQEAQLPSLVILLLLPAAHDDMMLLRRRNHLPKSPRLGNLKPHQVMKCIEATYKDRPPNCPSMGDDPALLLLDGAAVAVCLPEPPTPSPLTLLLLCSNFRRDCLRPPTWWSLPFSQGGYRRRLRCLASRRTAAAVTAAARFGDEPKLFDVLGRRVSTLGAVVGPLALVEEVSHTLLLNAYRRRQLMARTRATTGLLLLLAVAFECVQGVAAVESHASGDVFAFVQSLPRTQREMDGGGAPLAAPNRRLLRDCANNTMRTKLTSLGSLLLTRLKNSFMRSSTS